MHQTYCVQRERAYLLISISAVLLILIANNVLDSLFVRTTNIHCQSVLPFNNKHIWSKYLNKFSKSHMALWNSKGAIEATEKRKLTSQKLTMSCISEHVRLIENGHWSWECPFRSVQVSKWWLGKSTIRLAYYMMFIWGNPVCTNKTAIYLIESPFHL